MQLYNQPVGSLQNSELFTHTIHHRKLGTLDLRAPSEARDTLYCRASTSGTGTGETRTRCAAVGSLGLSAIE